jgi:MSHA pilin protein MshC
MHFKKIKKRQGFTLVELVIIIVLLGIISSIVVPRLSNASIFSTRANQDKILFFLKTAQKTAIAQRRDIYVSLNNETLSLCYVSAKPCPQEQQVLLQNNPYNINVKNTNLIISDFKFNSKGNTNNNKINIKFDDKNIYIEEESGFIHT